MDREDEDEGEVNDVSMPLATLVQTSLGLYRSPTVPGR